MFFSQEQSKESLIWYDGLKSHLTILQVNNISKYPNFNFNLSHHGEWVILGSEPQGIIGVDVMNIEVPHRKTDKDVHEFFDQMVGCFTNFEWKNIRYTDNLDKQAAQFFRHWTLKECMFNNTKS